MDKWIAAGIASGYLEELPSDGGSGVHCVVSDNPWYEGGVAVCWSLLNQRRQQQQKRQQQQQQSSQAPASLAQDVKAFLGYGAAQLARGGEGGLMVTSVDVKAPWELPPLSAQAQALSVFAKESAPPAPARYFAFTRGPPGQREARDNIDGVLRSVEQQLQTAGLRCQRFLSSFAIFSEDFSALLDQTGRVHRALRASGLAVDAAASALVPTRVLPCAGADATLAAWTSLPLAAVTSTEDAARLLTDLFFQWLEDSYAWRCQSPVAVFASSEADVAARQLQLFELFVHAVVRPHAARLQFAPLTEMEDGMAASRLPAALSAAVAPLLQRGRQPRVGPQKWGVMELRQVLCLCGAYGKDPLTTLRTTAVKSGKV